MMILSSLQLLILYIYVCVSIFINIKTYFLQLTREDVEVGAGVWELSFCFWTLRRSSHLSLDQKLSQCFSEIKLNQICSSNSLIT